MQAKWKERLDERQTKFATAHEALKIVDSLDDLTRLSNGKQLFGELAFDFPILVRSSLMDLKKPAPQQWGNINSFAELIGLYDQRAH
jgi:hypothetical protein